MSSDEGEAVEVLGHDAVAVEFHAVDRAGTASTLRLLGRVGKRVELEWLRDVAAASTGGPEAVDGGGEPADGRLDRLVGEVLRRLPRELGVDLRGLAVSQRLAEQGVAVRHRQRFRQPLYPINRGRKSTVSGTSMMIASAPIIT